MFGKADATDVWAYLGSDAVMVVGDVFQDKYDILELIGQGGFGVVHKATQRTTGQLVAIKTLLPRGDEARREKAVARFLRETQLCAQLRHPNIVQLMDAGTRASNQLYAVFVYVPGKTLSRVLTEEGPLEPSEVKHLMLQVLDALACAHAQGIVHRDLKPGNVMVMNTGARRNAMVLDFGIGTVVKSAESESHERLTGTSEMVGTPGYAAPEQLNHLELSSATDLFSWGLVFLECLTGRPVFHGATLHEMLFKQLGPEPVTIPLSIRNHPLGKLLEEVTRKDMEKRPRDAAAILKRLEACNLRGISRATIQADEVPRSNFFTSMTFVGPVSVDSDEIPRIGEKRQITALCCQLQIECTTSADSPSDSIRRDIDGDEQTQLLLDCLSEGMKVVTQQRGIVASSLGSRVLFYFGYPDGDEQDAKRAVLAATAFRTIVDKQNAELIPQGVKFTVRMGVHSGMVALPTSQEMADMVPALGATPAIADRIADLAAPGTILVSSATQRGLRTSFTFDAAGTLADVASPWRLYRLEPKLVANATTQALDRLPLIGREAELKLLLGRWIQVRQGVGQCCFVTGETGIGTSRLVQELRTQIRDENHLSLTLRCLPDAQDLPFAPVIKMLERFVAQEPGGDDDRTKLEAFFRRHGLDVGEDLRLVANLLSIPIADGRRPVEKPIEALRTRTIVALKSLFFAWADSRPVFMVVEDLHWADPSTLEWLSLCIEQIASVPLCMFITARPDFSMKSLPNTGIYQVALGRLGSGDVEALVAEVYEGRGFPDEVLKQILKKSEGVPLLVEEFAQTLVDVGVIALRDGDYELTRPLRDSDVPATLRDLLALRINRMGSAKETVQVAAVIGREFNWSLLAAVIDRSPTALHEDLEKLRVAAIVQASRGKDYVFKHALIRDALYEAMPHATRQTLHARVAAVLEQQFPLVVATCPDLLAHHHAAAGQKREAIKYLQRAAESAVQKLAQAEAATLARRALTWLEAIEDPSEREVTERALTAFVPST